MAFLLCVHSGTQSQALPRTRSWERTTTPSFMGGSAYNEHLRGQTLAWAPREGPRALGGPGFSQPPMIITAATQMTPLHGDRPHEGAFYIATRNNPTLHLGKWRFER